MKREAVDEEVKTINKSDSENEGPLPMPMPQEIIKKKRRALKFEKVYLDSLPTGQMYEMSYMHRDVVTHVLITPKTSFLITASRDGHIKFWKKMTTGFEFVKHYKSHLSQVNCLACSMDGLRLFSTSTDQNIKFYDILSFDMIHMIKVSYIPTNGIWITASNDAVPLIAIADASSSSIRIYNAEGVSNDAIHIVQIHHSPVTCMAFNSTFNTVVSGEQQGVLEYWSSKTFNHIKKPEVQFNFKLETDLYDLAKAKTTPFNITFSPNGNEFVVTSRDKQIRIFRYLTGKLHRKYNEEISVFEDAQADGSLHLEELDFGRRIAVEKELEASLDSFNTCNALFDESGQFLIYSTLLGIKLVNIKENKLVRVYGKVENTERFLSLSLFQGIPKVSSQYQSDAKLDPLSMDETLKGEGVTDPVLVCTAFKKHRFYYFSKREPLSEEMNNGQGRDVFNEKPTKEETEVAPESTKSSLGNKAIIHTTIGDIHLKLFLEECPKTIENFCIHSKNGYYDGVLFHRVIKNFMIQTGDPLGDGTGGESIWGGEFEDEIHRNLRHDRPFTVSMANAGPNTNGSQFFITTVPTPWLDKKHTVFGRVERGMDTVGIIENVRVDRHDKPYEDIKIVNIDILNE